LEIDLTTAPNPVPDGNVVKLYVGMTLWKSGIYNGSTLKCSFDVSRADIAKLPTSSKYSLGGVVETEISPIAEGIIMRG
jgi:hypothetical protein